MLSTVTPILLYIAATLGVIGCVASVALLLWSVYQQAQLRMEHSGWRTEKTGNDEGADASTNGSASIAFRRMQLKFRQNYHWAMVAYAIIFLIAITWLLLSSKTVFNVKRFGSLLLIMSGLYLVVLLLRGFKNNHQSNSNYWNTAFHATRTIGSVHLYVATLALSYYSIATVTDNNPAFDETSFYHGPAPILSYQGSNQNYKQIARSATIQVGYGGSWACGSDTDTNDMWCEQQVDLMWCDIYDKTGFWAGDKSMQPTWRVWEGEDLWQTETSEFSCAMGMGGYNNNDDGDEDASQDNQDDQVQDYQEYKYLDSPLDAPYLINIFADCEGSCKVMIDDPLFRDKFYFVSSLRYLLLASSLAALLFFSLAGLFRWKMERKNSTEGESLSHKVTAGVELLSESDKTPAQGVAT